METPSLYYNTSDELSQAAESSRLAFASGRTRPLPYRRKQLQQLWRLLDENTDLLHEAIYKDLRKHKVEFVLGEITQLKEDINHALENLEEWAKDGKVVPTLVNRLSSTCVTRKEPKGNVLIIAPWNYPVFLTLGPVVGAMAAGCTAVIKPSEVSVHSAIVLAELLRRYIDNQAYPVVNGAVAETTQLLKMKWDHIFYTGNGTVAKIILKAAAEHLTSCTLELGGKSPCVVDENANMYCAARRIINGKCFNVGQTCVSPDYVLTTAKGQAKLVPELLKAIEEMYGTNPHASADYGRIINDRQFHRLQNILNSRTSGDLETRGSSDEKDLYIPPTVISNVDRDDVVMKDELFGPILPIVQVTDVDDAIEFINSRDHSLVLYVFSSNKKYVKKVLDSTRSGGVLVNDTMMHVSEHNMPFGGVGPSGMGSYRGKASFDAFTHVRSTMYVPLTKMSEVMTSQRYTPYLPFKLVMGRWVLETTPHFKKSFVLKHLRWIILAVLFGVGRKVYAK